MYLFTITPFSTYLEVKDTMSQETVQCRHCRGTGVCRNRHVEIRQAWIDRLFNGRRVCVSLVEPVLQETDLMRVWFILMRMCFVLFVEGEVSIWSRYKLRGGLWMMDGLTRTMMKRNSHMDDT